MRYRHRQFLGAATLIATAFGLAVFMGWLAAQGV